MDGSMMAGRPRGVVERVELEGAKRQLAEAIVAARACGYRADSEQMRSLRLAEDRLRRARRRWQMLLAEAYAAAVRPVAGGVVDLRDRRAG